jgi:acetoacetate decarboxylase
MFRIDENLDYNMPVHFGGVRLAPGMVAVQRATALVIGYETDRAELERYIPEEFDLKSPEVQVMFSRFHQIEWLAGSRYNLINVSAPVRFHGKKDRIEGDYTLVTWENKTEPILRGREQTGIPKIYADIEDLHVVGSHFGTTASYEGSTFLTLHFESSGPVTGRDLDQMKSSLGSLNTLGWRYIPRINGPGADLSQFILFPQRMEVETAQAGTGTLKWTELTWLQHPTQHHIINSLAALPIKKVTQAGQVEGRVILDRMGSRAIE